MVDRVAAAGFAGIVDDDYHSYLNASLASMDIYSQRAACLMADYDDLADAMGPTSDQAKLARDLYAAAVFDAARNGVMLPHLDPMFTALVPPSSPGDPNEGSTHRACVDDIFGSRHDGCLFIAPHCDASSEVFAVAKKKTTERQSQCN